MAVLLASSDALHLSYILPLCNFQQQQQKKNVLNRAEEEKKAELKGLVTLCSNCGLFGIQWE